MKRKSGDIRAIKALKLSGLTCSFAQMREINTEMCPKFLQPMMELFVIWLPSSAHPCHCCPAAGTFPGHTSEFHGTNQSYQSPWGEGGNGLSHVVRRPQQAVGQEPAEPSLSSLGGDLNLG